MGDKEQILGKDTDITSVLLDNMSASYRSIAIVNQLRSVSHDFKTTLNQHMLPVCADGTIQPRDKSEELPMLYTHKHMPLFLQDLHSLGRDGTQALFAPLLDDANNLATSPQHLHNLEESDKTAYIRMTLLYTHEPAMMDILNVLCVMRENKSRFANFLRAVGEIAPVGRNPFVKNLLKWMETHRSNQSIQIKGLLLLYEIKASARELYENNASAYWCRMADAMTLHFDSHIFRTWIFVTLFGRQDQYRVDEHASLDDFFENYYGDLTAADAITVVCCNIIERCLGSGGNVNIATRIVMLLDAVFTWNIDKYATLPAYSRAARQIQRLFEHFKENNYFSYKLLWILKGMQTMDLAVISQYKILRAAVDTVQRVLKNHHEEEEERDVILVVVHAIALWADDSRSQGDPERDFLVKRAIFFISYITPIFILHESCHDSLHKIVPGDIVKLLSRSTLLVKNELQTMFKDNGILSIVIAEIYRTCMQKKLLSLCIEWVYCLYALVEDNSTCQEEVLRSSVVLVMNTIFGKMGMYCRKLIPSFGSLLVLLMSQSFDKFPQFVSREAIVDDLRMIITNGHKIPRPVVYRFVDFCDEMRSRKYLDFGCAHTILEILGTILKKYCLASRAKPDHVLQEKVVEVLARMAKDDPTYQHNAPKNMQTKRLRFAKKGAWCPSANYDANMVIVREYFL